MSRRTKKLFSLLVWYVPVLLVQIISAQVTIGSIDPWYANLVKSAWNPPPWVFGPAWTILYIMMTVAVWIIYHENKSKRQGSIAYSLFFCQLVINGLWSFLFFGAHMVGAALINLGLLIFLVGLTAIHFFRVNSLAGWLLLPYFMWITYAFSLNAAIYWLN